MTSFSARLNLIRSSVLRRCAFYLHRKRHVLRVLLFSFRQRPRMHWNDEDYGSWLRKDLGLPEDNQNWPDIHTGRR